MQTSPIGTCRRCHRQAQSFPAKTKANEESERRSRSKLNSKINICQHKLPVGGFRVEFNFGFFNICSRLSKFHGQGKKEYRKAIIYNTMLTCCCAIYYVLLGLAHTHTHTQDGTFDP